MTRVRTIADRLADSRSRPLPGRERELARLLVLTAPDGPVAAYVHGPDGIGKSALLARFAVELADRDVDCVQLRGSAIEPQPGAVVDAVAQAVGVATEGCLDRLAGALADNRLRFIVIDDVDALQLTATWLRRQFLPALPATARLVLAGRSPPASVWHHDLGPIFLELRLGSLDAQTVDRQILAAGLDPTNGPGATVQSVAGGHPLTLHMALEAARGGSLEAAYSPAQLADAVLAARDGLPLRPIVEAAATLRRWTRPMIEALLAASPSEIDELQALPFVRLDREGYFVAEPVRQALVERLAATDPARHVQMRHAAVRWITQRLETATPGERWRHMADLLHLVEHAQIRDAFFPPEAAAPPVEPAERDDFTAIHRLCRTRAGAHESRLIERWAQELPHRFSVARGSDGSVLAFYVYARDDDPLDDLLPHDPLLAAWFDHRSRHPVPGSTLFLRQLLAAVPGETQPERAACTLDVKRVYFERWDLARVYTAASASVIEGPLMRRLGFRPLSPPANELPGAMVLDLPGAGLVGWISTLVGMPVKPKPALDFDFARDRRELAFDDQRVQLTPLEAGVLAALIDAAPAVVTRDALIASVWRRAYVGSNAVDALIRTLRRKLGPLRDRIVTVSGAGYRYRP